MKKGILLLVLLSICRLAFADTQSSTEAATLTDNSFVITGYYKGAVTTTVSLIVRDYDTNRLYNTDAVATDELHVGQEGNIFTWIMTGTASSELTVTFTFSTLQAKVLNKYYRPAYTLKMYQNQTTGPNSDEFYKGRTELVQIASDGTHTATKPNTPSNSRYTQTGSVSYSGRVSNNNGSVSWVRSGYCTLNISDYEDTTPGSYNYTCTVIVEISLTV